MFERSLYIYLYLNLPIYLNGFQIIKFHIIEMVYFFLQEHFIYLQLAKKLHAEQ